MFHLWLKGFFRLPLNSVTPFLLLLTMITGLAVAQEPNTQVTARQLYNDGTRKFKEGKLREAEGFLQSAVASQNEKVQDLALYNLGHVRFQQGVEALKAAPDGKAVQAQSDRASQSADGAIQAVDRALAGSDLDAIVSAYMQGRGARKELKGAIEAVKHAMESKAAVLTKWQRAAGDFKSAHELRTDDEDARINAEVVDRSIAKLVDQRQAMTMSALGMMKKKGELEKKMGQLKKKMPDGMGKDMKGGSDDDDDEEENKPKGPKEGQQEGPSRDGKEQILGFEEAQRLLDMLKLDSNRKLSLGGFEETTKPKDRKNRRDW